MLGKHRQALRLMEVQTDEPSTRPKVHLYRDLDAQTEEPSTSSTAITSHAVDIASEVDEPTDRSHTTEQSELAMILERQQLPQIMMNDASWMCRFLTRYIQCLQRLLVLYKYLVFLQVAAQPKAATRDARITSDVMLNLFVAVGVPGPIQFVSPGHFLWKEPHVLIAASKGEPSLMIREPEKRLKFPSMVRSLKEFRAFADEHKISLVGVNIDEVVDEMEARGRLMAGVGMGGYIIPLWIQATVRDGYSRELRCTHDSLTLSLWAYRCCHAIHFLRIKECRQTPSPSVETDLGK